MISRLSARTANPFSETAKFHVLVLDDAPASRAETRRLLTQGGVKKISDSSGAEQDLGAHDPAAPVDIILSEMNLRDGSGLVVLKAIRLGRIASLRPDTCFIFLTDVAQPQLVATAQQLDANGFLVKPIGIDRLRMALVRGHARSCLVDIAKYRGIDVANAARLLV